MTDGEETRPSFTAFWKKSRQKPQFTNDETLLSSSEAIAWASSSSNPSPKGATLHSDANSKGSKNLSDKEGEAKAKNQARRAQVRRAQIQHRQRKANYVKQLELDISLLRDLIAQTENDTMALMRENADIKTTLRGAGVIGSDWNPPLFSPQSPKQCPQGQSSNDLSTLPVSSPANVELFGNVDVNELTVTLSMNSLLGTPTFTISSSSSNASVRSQKSPPPISEGQPAMTLEEQHVAINFILALEHVCWDHFSMGDFPIHHHHNSEQENGHTLMATTYCMANAPENVYSDRQDFKKKRFSRSTSRSASPTLQWNTSGITLESLYGLAQSLNPSNDLELTPVQAWFELAARYPSGILLERSALQALQREFKGVVKCVEFGAAMERLAFESVVGRVLGPIPGIPNPVGEILVS